MTGLQVASPTRSGQLQLDGGGVDAGPVEELLVHDGAGVVHGGTDDAATLKFDLQSPFLSIHRSHTVSGTAHFCWKHPLPTFAHTSPSYSDSLIHSSFSPLSHIGSFITVLSGSPVPDSRQGRSPSSRVTSRRGASAHWRQTLMQYLLTGKMKECAHV